MIYVLSRIGKRQQNVSKKNSTHSTKMVMIGQQHACLMLGDEERGEKGLSL